MTIKNLNSRTKFWSPAFSSLKVNDACHHMKTVIINIFDRTLRLTPLEILCPNPFALQFKISENLLNHKPFKTPTKVHFVRKNKLRQVYFLRLPNLHTAPMGHLIKIRTFYKK